MITRRWFLAISGATAAAAALPGKEAVASTTKKSLDYKLTASRYVKPTLGYGKYLRPGVYIGDTRPTVPAYTYIQQPGLRALYEYLQLLDDYCGVPGVYYDNLAFLDHASGTPFAVQGRTNIPREKVDSMWDEAMQKAWMPSGTVLNPHTGTRAEDFMEIDAIFCNPNNIEAKELLDTYFSTPGFVGGKVVVRKGVKWRKV